jgi:preprotein translocase subunit SecD
MLHIQIWKRVLICGLILAGLLFALPNAFYSRVESFNDASLAIENGQDPKLFKDEKKTLV